MLKLFQCFISHVIMALQKCAYVMPWKSGNIALSAFLLYL